MKRESKREEEEELLKISPLSKKSIENVTLQNKTSVFVMKQVHHNS